MARQYSFRILAPQRTHFDPVFRNSGENALAYRHHLWAVQRLRGRIYFEDGAIGEQSLDPDGRFRMCGDEEAWHLLLLDCVGEVVGCARYALYPSSVPYQFLRISHSAIGKDPAWADSLRDAVETDLRLARQRGLSYLEVGGWALSEEWRRTRAALEIAVASYALVRLWGGAIGSCTATVRHGSSSILRRLGGSQLVTRNGEVLPSYFDPRYGCVMELLRFDYVKPASLIASQVDEMAGWLAETEVFTARLDHLGHGRLLAAR